MSASQETIAATARARLRDFGQFFETPYDRGAPTLRLSHPMIEASTLSVWHPADGVPVTAGYMLDARNGVLKFDTPTDWTGGVGVSGYHYTWFLNEDLMFFAGVTINYHMEGREDASIGDFTATEADAISIGTVVQALWSLASELSTDIDVSTPEGMNIPASQRFRQVWEMLQYWQAEYRRIASLLNVGLERIEQFCLRRTSLTTNRLVPVYRPREFGDPRWPERIYPKIDPHKQSGDHSTAGNELDVYSSTWGGW